MWTRLSPACPGWPAGPALTRQARLPGRARGRGRITPFAATGRVGTTTHAPQACLAGRRALDESGLQGQPGQVGAAPAAGLVPDPVQVGADGADADVQLGGDLGVGAALGDQGDQLPLPGAELPQPRRGWRLRAGAVSRRAYSAAVARLIAAPRSSAARVRAGPSACRASRSDSRRRSSAGQARRPPRRNSAAVAAHTVTASAGRPVAAHRYPQQSRPLPSSSQPPVRAAIWSASRRCAAASSTRPACRSKVAICGSRPTRFRQVARVPGPGQPRRAHLLGGGQVPGPDQHAGQEVAAPAGLSSRGRRP